MLFAGRIIRRLQLRSASLLQGPCPLWRRLANSTASSQRSASPLCCFSGGSSKRKVVFLGTPEVAAQVLQDLLQESNAADSTFQVAAVVSQPSRPKGRGNRKVPQPSPVEILALERGIPREQIWCPVKANEEEFLARLRGLQPDLCLTAAYGNILPKAFLAVPRHGTLNIHPSLLPKYRGAAPVQRALQDGCSETGVSVAFTVRAMDAGPVLAQQSVPVDADIQAPELLSQLFRLGTRLLVERLPQVWSGEAAALAIPQDESQVVHASKLAKEEGVLDFREPAWTVHNKVRAFAGWPGTTAWFELSDGSEDGTRTEPLKVLRTRIAEDDNGDNLGERPQIVIDRQSMFVQCGRNSGDGSIEILQVQPLGKRAMNVASFLNGLNGRTLKLA